MISRGHKSYRRKLVALAVASCFAAELAHANPTGPTVVRGQASFATQGNTLTVTNSPGTVINWQSFSIPSQEITRFLQQSAASAVLNRVTGTTPSSILGQMQSNGRVYLINPNGITIGQGAVIDVAGFVASSLNLSDADFAAGRHRFTETPGAGAVINRGEIKTSSGGMVYLVGQSIENHGVIKTPEGEIVLAAGKSIELVDAGTPEIRVQITAPDNQALNLGQMLASGGRIGMYAGLVRHGGTANANTAVVGENGKIVFRATRNVTLEAGSVTTASGPTAGSIKIEAETGTAVVAGLVKTNATAGPGGSVDVSGQQGVVIETTGRISANGSEGGVVALSSSAGPVRVAGKVSADASAGRGGRVSVAAATQATLAASARITASGTQGGGSVSVTANDGVTLEAGSAIQANGSSGGNVSIDAAVGPVEINGSIEATGGDAAGGTITVAALSDITLGDTSVLSVLGKHGGEVRVEAWDGTTLVSGLINAFGSGGQGGKVLLLGARVGLIRNARVNVSGRRGGGEALVGGDFQGSNSDVQNADRTYVGPDVVIAADAIGTGDGGKVIIWSDEATRFYGTITARGGANGGNGGFVEVSGKEFLNFYGKVDVGAPAGRAGTILLDPRDITVQDTGGANNGEVTPTTDESILFADGGTGDFTVNDETLEALNGNIVLQATRDITISAGLSGGGLVLTNQTGGERVVLQAGRHIKIDSPLTTNGAAIWLEADSPHVNGGTPPSSTGADGAGAVRINAAVQSFISAPATGGKITLIAGTSTNGGNNGGGFDLNADVNAGAGGIDVALSTQNTGQLSFFIGSAGQAQFTSSDTGQLKSTGQLRIGQATTAGTDGLGLDQYTIKVDQLAVGTSAGGPVTLASDAGTSLVLTAGDGGILVDRPLSANQTTSISTTGALTINSPLTTNGADLNITAASVSGFQNIFGAGTINCSGSGCVTEITWDGGGGNLNWFTAANWSGDVVPTISNDVKILSSTGTIVISGANAFAKSLIADVPLAVSSTWSLSVAQPSQFTQGLSLSGSLLGAGAVAVQGGGNLTWNGGAMGAGGLFTIGVGGSGTLSGTLALDRAFVNSGLLTLGTGSVGATISGAITGSITNAMTMTAASGTSNTIGVALSNNPATAAIQVLGSLAATNFPTNAGQIIIGNGGTFSTGGNALTNTAASSVTINAGNYSTSVGNTVTTDGSGNLAVSGALGAGTVTLLAGGSGGVTLNSGSTVTASGTGDSLVISGASFTNNSSSGALNPGSGRWLVYSTSPAGSTENGLTGVADPTLPRLYGRTYSGNPPGSISEPGSHLIYSTQPTLTATADNKAKTYGGADPALTYTVSGFINDDGLLDSATTAGLGGAPVLSTATGAAATAGTHTITTGQGTLVSTAGYSISTANGTLTVGKAALTATADDKAKTYGGADPALTYTVGGTLFYSDTAAVVSGVSLATNTGAAATAGTHTITASGGTAANYNISTANGTLTVGKAALTATADDKAKTYGGADPALTYTVGGTLFYSDTAAVVSGVSLATNTGAAATAGTHTITASGGTAANYNISTANGTLTVGKAALTATADDKAKTYGGADPALTYTVGGTLFYSDTAAVVSGVSLATNTGAAATAGTHTITASGGTAANYNISTANGTLTVGKAALTATADDKAKTYGGADPALTYTVGGTLFYSDTAAVVSGVSLATNTGAAATAGTHTITASGGTAANYNISTANGTLTVGKAALTATADDKAKTYGGADPALTYTVGGTLFYSDTAAVVSGVSLATNTGAAATAGTHTITASGGTAANYNISTANGTLTVGKAALTATADDKAKTYGGADPALTYTVGGTLFYSDTAAVVSGVSLATNTGAAATAGTHTITASGGTAANYNISTANGTLTVGKAALTATADDKAKTYGGADPALTYTVGGTLFYSDTAAVVSGVSLATNTGAAATAGTHTITASGGTAANYNISTANGTLTVGKAALTATADDKAKTYGGADPALTYTVGGTLFYSDTAAVVSGVSLATNTGAAATAGTHTITASGGTAANYNISTANGTLTVGKAALTATADDKAKTYGGADPALTYTVGGTLFYSDTAAVVSGVSLATNTGAAATAGTHTITASGGTAANYNISTANGTLTVGKAALTATADDKAKTYGGADPALTYTVGGTLFYSDTAAVVSGVSLATNTGAAATAGTHTITASGGTAANYNISTANGTLTVGKAALTATADDKAKTYGGADPALTYTVGGTLFYSDTAAVVSGVSLATNTGAAATAGTHTITASGGTAANYNISTANGTLTVGKAALTATADDKAKTYGGADPALTYTVGGTLFYSDTAAVVSGVSLATNTGAAATAGTHTITASGGTAANYNISTANGTLTVGKAALTATADDKAKTYGGADPALTYTVGGTLFYSDTAAVVSGVSLATNTGAAATAGTHTITASGGTAANYNISTANGTLTVGKAALTATADDKAKTYGGADPALTYTVGGTLFYSDTAAVVSGVSLATNTGAAATAGTHTITASGGTAANYNISTANGTLTVGKAALTATADDKAKTYGGADPALTYTVGGTLFYSDTAAVVSGVSLATNTGAAATAGTHTITASGGTAANYNISTANGTLTVGKAALTATADDKAKTYGGADPALTYTVGGTLFYSDTAAVVSGVSLATNTGAAATAGTHTITASGGTAANYNISTANGTLTVNRALINLALSRTYNGSRNFGAGLIGTLIGVNGETLVGGIGTGTVASPNVAAGTQTLSLGSLALGNGTGLASNYTLIGGTHTATITPKNLTGTIANQAKTYGADDPALAGIGITLGGVIISDASNVAATLSSLARASGENVGSYGITSGTFNALTGSAAGNYNAPTFIGSPVLLINQAPLTAGISNQVKTYGVNDPALSTIGVTLGGLINRTVSTWNGTVALNDVGSVATTLASLARAGGENVGSYGITSGTLNALTGSAAGNYSGAASLNTAGKTLTINPVPLTASIADQTKTYASNDPAVGTIAVTLSGAVNASVTDWNGNVTAINDAVALAPALTDLARAPGESIGSYNITGGTLTLSGAAASNYSGAILNTSGTTLAIVPPPPNAVVSPTVTTWDGTAPVDINFVWTAGASGSWTTGTSWDKGFAPVNGAVVTIPDIGAPGVTNAITYSGGTINLRSLTSSEALTVAGGALNLGTTPADVSTIPLVTLSGGVLGGAGTVNVATMNILAGGILNGTGTIIGNVNNTGGTVAPGVSPGKLTINGNYVQGPGGTLAVEIGGTAAGTQYDQLVVTGNATLDGTLSVALINGFVPVSGNSFTVVQGGTVSGVFATTNLSSMTTTYLASSVNVATNAPPPQLPPSAPAPPLIDQLPGLPESGSGTGLNVVTVVNPQTGEREILDGFVGQNIVTTVNPETGERQILDGVVGQNVVTTVNPQTGEREIVDVTAGDSKSGGKIGVCK